TTVDAVVCNGRTAATPSGNCRPVQAVGTGNVLNRRVGKGSRNRLSEAHANPVEGIGARSIRTIHGYVVNSYRPRCVLNKQLSRDPNDSDQVICILNQACCWNAQHS